jgi:hypothetical protein
MLQVRVEDLVMHGYTPKGFGIAPGGFTGWSSGTTRRGPKTNKPNGGDYAIKRVSGSRQVLVSGTCLASSEGALMLMGEQLTALGSDGELVRVTVDQAGKTTWADGYVDGETTFEQIKGQKYAAWDIEFYIPSPLKFGEARTFQSGEKAFHRGNFQAAPVFTVSGSRPAGYVINGPAGLSRSITRPLVSGQPHTIDMRTGRLSIGGTVISRSSSGDTWGIPKGAEVVSTLVGAGDLAQRVRDTYY